MRDGELAIRILLLFPMCTEHSPHPPLFRVHALELDDNQVVVVDDDDEDSTAAVGAALSILHASPFSCSRQQ